MGVILSCIVKKTDAEKIYYVNDQKSNGNKPQHRLAWPSECHHERYENDHHIQAIAPFEHTDHRFLVFYHANAGLECVLN